jgi:parallel beta-helix repeat protein
MTANAAPTTWFVSKSGNDSNSCSLAQSSATAKRTIKAGLACIGSAGSEAGAGHTLQVAAGTYTESLVDVIPSGSGPSAQFTLKCASHLACTLSESIGTFNMGFNTPSHYIVIRDFIITAGSGVYTSGAYDPNPAYHHHFQWLNNEFVGLPNFALQSTSANYFSVIGNKFHDIGDNCPESPGRCHGIYGSLNTNYWTISQNEIYDVSGYGIHIYPDVGSAMSVGYVIDRNLIHNVGTPGVNGAGILVYGYDHVITNNVLYSNTYQGILLRSVGGNQIYNNTTYNNGAGGILMEGGVSTACKNNLTIADAGPEISGCTTIGNNITTGTAASHFVSPSTANFTLLAGSTAVKAGASLSSVVLTDYTGAVRATPSDVGAYQLSGSAPAVDAIAPVPGGGGLLTGSVNQ